MHAAGGQRLLPQPPDRRLHRRRPHVRALHNHVGGEGGPGERLLHPLVRLHRGERLRERLRAGLDHAELERGQRERDQEPAREDGGQERPAEDSAHDRAPDPTLAVVAAKPADERNPTPVDPVAEPRQQRRQHGQRPDHRHRDYRDRGDREGLEDRVAGEEHAGHRRHHGQAGDEHGAARGRGCGLQRGPLATARRSLFAFSLQVEERVVDADGEPDQEHERTRFVRHREDVAGAGDDAEGGEDGCQGEQQRDACSGESAERDHEDDERDREGEHPGLAEILRGGGGDCVDGAGHAELADVELRVRLSGRPRPGRGPGRSSPPPCRLGRWIWNSTRAERPSEETCPLRTFWTASSFESLATTSSTAAANADRSPRACGSGRGRSPRQAGRSPRRGSDPCGRTRAGRPRSGRSSSSRPSRARRRRRRRRASRRSRSSNDRRSSFPSAPQDCGA